MKKLVTMRRALDDPKLFGPVLAGDSWLVWRILLIAIMGEPLVGAERSLFERFTGRTIEPTAPVEEFWAIVGRRGGKTRAMSVLSAYLASLVDWRKSLVPGEVGRLFYLANTQKQGKLAFGYAKALYQNISLLAAEVASITDDTIELRNGIELEIRAAMFRNIRGATSIGVLLDEIAFFQATETSTNTDEDVLRALRPTLATTGAPLIAISSPFGKFGELYRTYERDYGPDGDPAILVARGASRDFNPSLPEKVVLRALERDEVSAKSEYLAEFRDESTAFVSLEQVLRCTATGVTALQPNKHSMPYFAFCDPAGGSGTDSFTLGIGHDGLSDKQVAKDMLFLDALVEIKPPFSPSAAVGKLCSVLEQYGLTTVYGDRYAAAWVVEAFKLYGVNYRHSPMNKSELFLEFLPVLNDSRCRLLDHSLMQQQIVGMRRYVTPNGLEKVDHKSNAHDDLANSAVGVIALMQRNRRKHKVSHGPLRGAG